MKEGGNGKIPSSVSGHCKTQKRPNSVVMERRNKDSGGTTCSKYVGPCPLVKLLVYVIYVATNYKINNSILLITKHFLTNNYLIISNCLTSHMLLVESPTPTIETCN